MYLLVNLLIFFININLNLTYVKNVTKKISMLPLVATISYMTILIPHRELANPVAYNLFFL